MAELSADITASLTADSTAGLAPELAPDRSVGSIRIPNIIHFVFGLRPQTEEWLFCYYLAVLSAYVVNRPEKICFYHHFPISGVWWERLQRDVPVLEVEHIELPTHIGRKAIKQTAHRADKARMEILWERGGVYMDMDTISARPYAPLLHHDTVLGEQFSLRDGADPADLELSSRWERARIGGICNAVMLTKPRSPFFAEWRRRYADAFDPDRWEEASVLLPHELCASHPKSVTVVAPEVFFLPAYFETESIFERACDQVPPRLLTLHLSETYAMKYLRKIDGWDWMDRNEHTLYARIMKSVNAKWGAEKYTDP